MTGALAPDLYQGALYVGESRLRTREYVHAALAFQRASGLAGTPLDRELARGLVHLAAAGYRGLAGDVPGRARQLAHARRRLSPYLPEARQLRLDELLATVERG